MAQPQYTRADLELAQRHVEEGRLRLEEQRERPIRMTADGLDTAEGEKLFDLILKLLVQMELHRDLIVESLRQRDRRRRD